MKLKCACRLRERYIASRFPYEVDVSFHTENFLRAVRNLKALQELAEHNSKNSYELAVFTISNYISTNLKGIGIFTLTEIEMLGLSPDHFLLEPPQCP